MFQGTEEKFKLTASTVLLQKIQLPVMETCHPFRPGKVGLSLRPHLQSTFPEEAHQIPKELCSDS